jgi:integrase
MDVRMLPTRDDVGHALTLQEEKRLLAACAVSRSRLLHPVVVLALSSAMRYSEIRLLTWGQIDLHSATLTLKTAASTDRVLPLNTRALAALRATEKIGSSGRTRTYNPPVNSRMLCH